MVLFDPDAVAEFNALRDAKSRLAVLVAAEKLGVLGPRLVSPHVKKVRGTRSLHELPPRGGRSTIRPLFFQRDTHEYIVVAIAPEAAFDPRGFRAAVARARERAAARYGAAV